jgi:hypothetical protein
LTNLSFRWYDVEFCGGLIKIDSEWKVAKPTHPHIPTWMLRDSRFSISARSSSVGSRDIHP